MFPSYSQEPYPHSHQHVVKSEVSGSSQIKLLLKNLLNMLTPNKPVTIRFQLIKDNKALTFNDLKKVHTEKIHVLLIDSSLSDYHHLHPLRENQHFVFNFTPKNEGSYRMWVDITSLKTNQQEFLVTDIKAASKDLPVKEEVALDATVSPYEFTLKLNSETKAGREVMATITVTKNGQPFTDLEPVMGAFAHVVGFSGDRSSIVHIHPMGKEPSKESDRGGSEIMFHIKFKKSGFVKLFAQFRINGQDIYVPFAIKVD
ncbi:hypothetical protein ACQUW5_15205 [Legionella sp. CNM-1927-20]|uniref:hypothetical protein n=1 Tax=Legionella sp. CNM-1927-20 TaxID=3422221 RepID=UPI00403AE041